MDYNLGIMFLFFCIALIASCVDAIAGGGGLIVLPALLSAGIPPTSAMATSKLGSVAGSFSASIHFLRKKTITLKSTFIIFITTFIGSVIGALILTRINNTHLKTIIPILLISFAIYFIFAPNLGKVDKTARLTMAAFALMIAPTLGFYDGFFGPGTGSFMAIACVFFLGFNLMKATAHAKIMNFASNLGALIFFLIYGKVIQWEIGLSMLAGQLIGGNIGARLAHENGHKLIRVVMVTISTLLALKILLFP